MSWRGSGASGAAGVPPSAARQEVSRTTIAIQKAITDLSRGADDFFEKLENCLNYNYDVSMAKSDLEQLNLKLDSLEKAFETSKGMHVCAGDAQKRPDVLLKEAVEKKASIEAEHQRFSDRASAALLAFQRR